jgi:hypothetical protein
MEIISILKQELAFGLVAKGNTLFMDNYEIKNLTFIFPIKKKSNFKLWRLETHLMLLYVLY